MRRILVREFGGPEVMKIDEAPTPKPGPGEVLVRVRAAGVNPVETYIRTGTYARKPGLPYVPGSDGAGEVEAVGAEVKRFTPGDRVYIVGDNVSTIAGAGTYAEYCVCAPTQLHPLPARASFSQGAALGVPYATAYRALFMRAHALPGETVLVHGATGGVGIAAVQIAHAHGMNVIGTGGTEKGMQAVRENGASLVVNHREANYLDAVLKATDGKGVNVVLEMSAHTNLDKDLTVLARHGCIVVIGNRGRVEIDPRGAMGRDAAILGMTLFNATPAELVTIHAALVAGLDNGTLKPLIGREFKLEEAPRAHEAVLEPGALGKIVLVPLMLKGIASACGAIAIAIVAATAALFPRVSAQEASNPGPHGKAVYDAHCVECHGQSGKGDGPSSFLLNPRPRDFTEAKYKIRSTETGTLPTDDDLIRSVRQGLYGTSMPAWQSILSDQDIRDVVGYVKSFSPRFASEKPQPVPTAVDQLFPSGAQSVARGGAVYEKVQCGKCHGTDGRGTGAAATEFEDDWKQPMRAADLTEPWTFRGGSTAREVYLRFITGMSGTPMPSFKDAVGDADMWDLANFVVSLARKPVWQMTAAEVASFYAARDAEARANPVKRGGHLANSLGCAVCHSPIDQSDRVIPGMKWAGGMRIRLEPFGDYPTGNLTSDKETGLGSWTDDELKSAITRGVLRDGTRLLPYPMDWPSFSTLTSEDLNALIAYIRTIPPVRNKVPRPSRTFLPLYLWGKFKMLILGGDPPMLFYAGNAGSR